MAALSVTQFKPVLSKLKQAHGENPIKASFFTKEKCEAFLPSLFISSSSAARRAVHCLPDLGDSFGGEIDLELEKEAISVAKSNARELKKQLLKEIVKDYGKLEKQKGPPSETLPNIVIVGRPNVGKSAIFNRLVGSEIAIVHDEPGVTRDRNLAEAEWCGQKFTVTDTGGVLTPPLQSDMGLQDAVAVTKPGGSLALAQAHQQSALAGLPGLIEKQAGKAVRDADVILFVVDGQAGVTGADEDIAQWLRRTYKSRKPILLAVNKCESPVKGVTQAAQFWSLGFPPSPVSAISSTGIGDLLDAMCSHFQSEKEEELAADLEGLERGAGPDEELGEDVDEEDSESSSSSEIGIAIIGRPNVGKSSLLNALLGEERSIVSELSGTTRDAVDSLHTGPDGQLYRLIDTAGMRRRGAVQAGGSRAESLSVQRALRAIGRADVVLLVLDALQGISEQEFRLAERVQAEGKACVIVVNKWDAVQEKDTNTTLVYEERLRARLRGMDWAPLIFASAASLQRVPKVLSEAQRVAGERSKRVSTATLNSVIQEAFNFQFPSKGRGGRRGKIYYCTQAAIKPPTFVFFVNDAKLFPELYRRYMEKQIRQNIGFPGTPIRLLWRSKKRDPEKGREASK